MLFNSLHFYVFAFIVIPVFFLLEKKGQKALLLWSSLYFYASLKFAFVPLLVISFIGTWYLSYKIEDARTIREKKLFLWLIVILNLCILGFFKYTDFFRSVVHDLSSLSGSHISDFSPIGIILPLGISFYTFQAMAYSIDIYRGQIPAERNFWDFSLFLLFFPQLVAGPIMRAGALIPQFGNRKIFQKENLTAGLIIIALGIFKKTFIADPITNIIDPVYKNPENFNWISQIQADLLFTVQIYCDFSGYSDIAIGIGRILGFSIPINFVRPYLARSVTEIWKRWHISLSSWLRDYVYIPLGGNKVSIARNYFNVFITMVIGGFWHGAAWTFVAWGSLHGFFMIVEKYFNDRGWNRFFQPFPAFIKVFYSMTIFVMGVKFFRALSMEKMLTSTKQILTLGPGEGITIGFEILIPILVLIFMEISEEIGLDWNKKIPLVSVLRTPIAISIIFVAGMIYTVTVSPQFYYFQF